MPYKNNKIMKNSILCNTDNHRQCNTDLDLLHHCRQGRLQPPKLLGGVLLLNNHHFITTLAEDSDSLGSRYLTFDLFHLIFLGRS